jgi:hypothetical protein
MTRPIEIAPCQLVVTLSRKQKVAMGEGLDIKTPLVQAASTVASQEETRTRTCPTNRRTSPMVVVFDERVSLGAEKAVDNDDSE